MFDFLKVKKVTKQPQVVTEVKDFENTGRLLKYFKDETGIDFENQQSIFQSKVKSFCRVHKISSIQECFEKVSLENTYKQNFMNYLTTNESFFYRERHQIEELVSEVKNCSGKVEILCAPSSHGEEPYSVVIALLEEGVDINKFSITGIDLSAEAIEQAKEAVYNEKSTRNLTEEILEKYFQKRNGLYYLNDEIKRKVDFKCMNLFSQEFEKIGRFDYILSRNMMIYFDTQTRKKAQDILHNRLKDPTTNVYYGHADLTHEHIKLS